MTSRKQTSSQKTATSVCLGNDYLPKKTTYQCTHNNWTASKPSKADPITLSEVLPHKVYPPPPESLKRTIYQDDFGSVDYQSHGTIYKETSKTANIISNIHHLPGVPLAPHDDIQASNSSTEPSQQQTGYKNKMMIAEDWAQVQKAADQQNNEYNGSVPNFENSSVKKQSYESLPTEQKRQFRWPVTDDIHVVTYQQIKNK